MAFPPERDRKGQRKKRKWGCGWSEEVRNEVQCTLALVYIGVEKKDSKKVFPVGSRRNKWKSELLRNGSPSHENFLMSLKTIWISFFFKTKKVNGDHSCQLVRFPINNCIDFSVPHFYDVRTVFDNPWSLSTFILWKKGAHSTKLLPDVPEKKVVQVWKKRRQVNNDKNFNF